MNTLQTQLLPIQTITKQKIFQTIYHKGASITSNNNNLKASLNIVKAGCTLFFENPLI